MPIKESSDELNPIVAAPATAVPTQHPPRSITDYIALAIATCGVGYLPLAPGTWGSIVGLIVFFVVRGTLVHELSETAFGLRLNSFHFISAATVIELFVAFVVIAGGIWAASRLEVLSGKKDPREAVIDEVAGQYLALIPVPLILASWWPPVVAFVLFRFFDIVKPYPARRFERLHGGFGIMFDDVVAGLYAAIVILLLVRFDWFA